MYSTAVVSFPSTFSFGSQPEVIFGCGTSRLVGERLRAIGARKVLLVVDKGVIDAGLAERVEDSLRQVDMARETFDGVTAEPTDLVVQAVADAISECDPDAVVAMGGGSAMDAAKAASAVVASGGQVLEYLRGSRRLQQAGRPVLAIATTSGTGAEVTPNAVITDAERKWKGAIVGPQILPQVAICDPELTLGLPSIVTANTGLDALTHCIECYANVVFNPYAKLTALEGIRVIGRYLRRAVAHGGDLATRWQMMWGANLGGLCISKGLVADVHALAGPISSNYGVPHGRANAILLPYVMEFSLPGAVEAYADVAEALGERVEGSSCVYAAERAVAAVRRLVSDCGGAQRLSECGVRAEDVGEISRAGFARGNRALNPRIATQADIESIYRAAL